MKPNVWCRTSDTNCEQFWILKTWMTSLKFKKVTQRMVWTDCVTNQRTFSCIMGMIQHVGNLTRS